MGLTKTEEFSRTQNEVANLAKALGHPARIAILQHLIKTKSCVCGDIVEELPLSQSTVSQHLNELKKAGWIKGSIEGPSVCYCIDEKSWSKAKKTIMELLESYKGTLCC
jgi:DNA-binding transcriptional ArsR family regulator